MTTSIFQYQGTIWAVLKCWMALNTAAFNTKPFNSKISLFVNLWVYKSFWLGKWCGLNEHKVSTHTGSK